MSTSDALSRRRRGTIALLAEAAVGPGCASPYPRRTVVEMGFKSLVIAVPRYARKGKPSSGGVQPRLKRY